MKFSFDHLVWFIKDPVAAISPLNEKGIHVANGGRHENWGTYNTLSYFGLSYIEFLGIENLAIAEKHRENRLVTQIVRQLGQENLEGPAKIAVRTDSIDELAVRLKEKGLKVYGPLPGERTRADGTIIRWSLLFPEGEQGALSLPFFIQWERSDEERLVDLTEQGLVIKQAPVFESVGFVVRDIDGTLQTWRKLFELDVMEEYVDSSLNARCVELVLSGAKLLFCEPLGDGMAEQVLKTRGESPFLVNFHGSGEHEMVEMLNGYWRI